MANTFFTVSTGTGLDTISTIYKRPVVYLDYIPINFIVSYSYSITVPKRLYWVENQRLLTLSEALTNGFQKNNLYETSGIVLGELTASEKESAVLEMEERLTGRWTTTDADKILQKRFWATMKNEWANYPQYHGVVHPNARVGADFLRCYSEEYLK